MRRTLASTPWGSSVAKQSSRRFARPAWLGTRLIFGLDGATAATRLRLQKSSYVPELVSDRRSVNAPERAADIQPSLPLQHLHAAAANGCVYVLIDPRPGNHS